jgi:hypothetical protein
MLLGSEWRTILKLTLHILPGKCRLHASQYKFGQLPRSPFERSLSGRRFRVLGVGGVPVSG